MKTLVSVLVLSLFLGACSENRAPIPTTPGQPRSRQDVPPNPPTPEPPIDRSQGAAWFLGAEKKVKVCLESSADFALPTPKQRELVTKAFATWGDYVRTKGLAAEVGADRVPAFGLELREKCDANTDLKFVFGTEDLNGQPLATHERTKYDANRGWGAGRIGIAKQFESTGGGHLPWKEMTLLPVLLHELGSIAGNDAVPGTILDTRLQSLIERHGEPALTGIDLRRELYVCAGCSARYEVKFQANKDNAKFMKLLLDEKVEKGDVTISLERHFFGGWKALQVKFKTDDRDRDLKIGEEVRVLSSKVLAAEGPHFLFRSYLKGVARFARSYSSQVEVLARRSTYGGDFSVTVEDNASVPAEDDPNGPDVFEKLTPQITLWMVGENGDPLSVTLSRVAK